MAGLGNVDLSYMFGLEPKDAVAYLQNKGYKITNNWYEMLEDAHSKAFTVSKMTNAQLLKDTHSLLQTSIKEGWSAGHAQKELKTLFQKKGWWGQKEVKQKDGSKKVVQLGSPRRVRTIYRTNIQTAFNAGRYLQQLQDVDIAPYFQYMCILDESTRPEHRAMHGKVFRYDDPIWAYLYPPNGWGCRCFVRSLTSRELERQGLTVENSGKYLFHKDVVVNQDTGESVQVAMFKTKDQSGRTIFVQPDAGWSYNVGKDSWDIDVLAFNEVKGLPQAAKDKFISDMALSPVKHKNFENFIGSVLGSGYKAKGLECTAGWMKPETLGQLENKKLKLETPVIVCGDNKVIHMDRDSKNPKQKLDKETIKALSSFIKDNDGVYLETKKDVKKLWFIKNLSAPDADGKECIKIVVHLNYHTKGRVLNYIVTSSRVKFADLKGVNIEKLE